MKFGIFLLLRPRIEFSQSNLCPYAPMIYITHKWHSVPLDYFHITQKWLHETNTTDIDKVIFFSKHNGRPTILKKTFEFHVRACIPNFISKCVHLRYNMMM